MTQFDNIYEINSFGSISFRIADETLDFVKILQDLSKIISDLGKWYDDTRSKIMRLCKFYNELIIRFRQDQDNWRHYLKRAQEAERNLTTVRNQLNSALKMLNLEEIRQITPPIGELNEDNEDD